MRSTTISPSMDSIDVGPCPHPKELQDVTSPNQKANIDHVQEVTIQVPTEKTMCLPHKNSKRGK
jgi:hypothetical protein